MTQGKMISIIYDTIDYLIEVKDGELNMSDPLERKVCRNIIESLTDVLQTLNTSNIYTDEIYTFEGQITIDDLLEGGT